MTSSSPARQNDWPRDDRGKWYTPKGADAQMQIDATCSKLMSEGRCFRCQKKGHLSKDCPEKTAGHQVRAVEAAPMEPPKGLSGKGRGRKRLGHQVFDSTATTKDLLTGVHVSSAGRSLSLSQDGASSKPASCFTSTDILSTTHSDIPPFPAMERVSNTTLNIRPMRHSMTSLSHPVPESTNQYSILTVYDTNDDSTDVSPKQGITAGPYMNEDLESDGALPTDQLHAEVALRPTTRPAKRPASSSSRVKASNEKATTISPVILTMETTSGGPLGVNPPWRTTDRMTRSRMHAPCSLVLQRDVLTSKRGAPRHDQ